MKAIKTGTIVKVDLDVMIPDRRPRGNGRYMLGRITQCFRVPDLYFMIHLECGDDLMFHRAEFSVLSNQKVHLVCKKGSDKRAKRPRANWAYDATATMSEMMANEEKGK